MHAGRVAAGDADESRGVALAALVRGSTGAVTSTARRKTSGFASTQKPYSTATLTARIPGVDASSAAAPGRGTAGSRTSTNRPCGVRITVGRAISPSRRRT